MYGHVGQYSQLQQAMMYIQQNQLGDPVVDGAGLLLGSWGCLTFLCGAFKHGFVCMLLAFILVQVFGTGVF